MPYICPNCGYSSEEEIKFCANCGTPMSSPREASGHYIDEPQQAPVTYGDAYTEEPVVSYPQDNGYAYPAPQQYEQPKKKGKAGVVIAVSAVALLLVAALVLVVILPLTAHVDVFGLHIFDNSPKGAVERVIRSAYVDFNAKDVFDVMFEQHYAAEDQRADDATIVMMQGAFDQLKAQAKENNAHITYQLLDEYYVEADKTAEYMEVFKQEGVDTSKIDKMLEVDFTISANTNESKDSGTLTALCVKAGGRWYVSAASLSTMMGASAQ